MNFLAWNCRGICSLFTNNELKQLLRRHRPSFLFICETHTNEKTVRDKIFAAGFQDFIFISKDKRKGGIVLAWDSNLNCQNIFTLPYAVGILWETSPSNKTYIIGVYLSNQVQERADQLLTLRDCVINLDGPVVIRGDFNCVTSRSEKEGGLPPNPKAITDFLAFILDLQLIDVGFSGPIFTWSNKHHIPQKVISSRLDRFLITSKWLDAWPETAVTHLATSSSDHMAIHLQCTPRESPTRRLFTFDVRWINNDEVRNIIINSWHLPAAGLPMYKVVSKLKRLRHKLFEWVRAGTSNSERKIRRLEDEIAQEK
ncbi:hypothetical protein LINPERHAP2_LOCUS41813 [Linum perenne]